MVILNNNLKTNTVNILFAFQMELILIDFTLIQNSTIHFFHFHFSPPILKTTTVTSS